MIVYEMKKTLKNRLIGFFLSFPFFIYSIQNILTMVQ